METLDSASIGRKTKESLIWNTFLPALFQVFRFVVSIIIARILEPRDFGIMGIASVVVFYSNSLSNLGLSTALLRQPTIDDSDINSVFSLNVAISVLLTIVLCMLAGPLATFFNVPELKLALIALSSIFLLTSFYTIGLMLHHRKLNFKRVSLIEVFRGLSQSLFTLALALLHCGYWSLILGTIFSNALGSILILPKTGWRPGLAYYHRKITAFIGFGLHNFFSVQLRMLGDYADKFILGKLCGPVSVGYYEKAFTTSYLPVETISNRIGSVMFSAFSLHRDNRPELTNYLRKSIVITSLLCFPVFFGLASCSSHFVLVLLGDKWAPMIGPLQILSFAFLIACIANIVNVLNMSVGKYKKQTHIRIYALAFFVVSCFIAAHFDLVWVSASVLLYNLLFLLLSWQLVVKSTSLPAKSLFSWCMPAFSCSLIMLSVIVLLVMLRLSTPTKFNLIALVGIGSIVYVGCLWLIDFEECRSVKRDAFNRIVESAVRLKSIVAP